MPWIVETLNEIVDAELEDPPADMLARFHYISELIAEFGLERVREPHVKQLRGALWEIRLQGRDGVSKRRRRLLTGDRTGDEASEGDFEMAKVNDLHLKWMKNGEYRKAHAELAPEFALARAVIDARVTAGLTQEQLAQRMETTQSVIARLESGRTRPSTQTLERLAAATGTRLRIIFEPAAAQ